MNYVAEACKTVSLKIAKAKFKEGYILESDTIKQEICNKFNIDWHSIKSINFSSANFFLHEEPVPYIELAKVEVVYYVHTLVYLSVN